MLSPPFIQSDFIPLTVEEPDGSWALHHRLSFETYGPHIDKNTRMGLGFYRVWMQEMPSVVYGNPLWWNPNQPSIMRQDSDIQRREHVMTGGYYVGETEPEIKRSELKANRPMYWHDLTGRQVLQAARQLRAGSYVDWLPPKESVVRLELNVDQKRITSALLFGHEMPLYTRDRWYEKDLKTTKPVKNLFAPEELVETQSYDEFIASLESDLSKPVKKLRK